MPTNGDVPILLLDVDGVLNSARLDLPEGWRRGTFNGFVLSWDPTVTARLRALHESARVEIQWLTTWTTNADRLLAEPMGLPRGLKTHAPPDAAPTGFLGPLGGPSGWWKLAAARGSGRTTPATPRRRHCVRPPDAYSRRNSRFSFDEWALAPAGRVEGEQKLSRWMGKYAYVSFAPHERPWDLETRLIELLDLPL